MKNVSWAEKECRLACERANPNCDFDWRDFDYACGCYKSALKAYNSLTEDGHSGTSFAYTRNILIRLMNNLPLSPIVDSDFDSAVNHESDDYLAKRRLKSVKQCPRMSSLFRYEDLDGKVTYKDVDRAYFVNIENPSTTYSGWNGFLDEMFPITMPYSPSVEKYKIYAQEFLVDEKNGDFDTKGILYVITPSGEKVDVGLYMTEKEGKMVEISKEEYDELLIKRIDAINVKAANHLIWTLVSNSASDGEIQKREKLYKEKGEEFGKYWFGRLSALCKFFCNADNYKYNTFSMSHALCEYDIDEFKDIPELVEIADCLKEMLEALYTIDDKEA